MAYGNVPLITDEPKQPIVQAPRMVTFQHPNGESMRMAFPYGTTDDDVNAYIQSRATQKPNRIQNILGTVADTASTIGNAVNEISLTNQANQSTLPNMKGAWVLNPIQTQAVLSNMQRANEFKATNAARNLDVIKREQQAEKTRQAEFKLQNMRFKQEMDLAKEQDKLEAERDKARIEGNLRVEEAANKRMIEIARIKEEGKEPKLVPVWENGKQVYREAKEGLTSEAKPEKPEKSPEPQFTSTYDEKTGKDVKGWMYPPSAEYPQGRFIQVGGQKQSTGKTEKSIPTASERLGEYFSKSKIGAKGITPMLAAKAGLDLDIPYVDLVNWAKGAIPDFDITTIPYYELEKEKTTGGGDGAGGIEPKRKKYNPNTDSFE
jgi:hypothetical protein